MMPAAPHRLALYRLRVSMLAPVGYLAAFDMSPLLRSSPCFRAAPGDRSMRYGGSNPGLAAAP